MKNKVYKITALLLAAFLFTGCADSQSGNSENGSRIINPSKNISNHGELYLDNEDRLNFMDYESMNKAVICSKPNCPHTDPETCSAFGMGSRQVLYGNFIYFIKSETVYEGDKLTQNMSICRANTDGSERKTIITEKEFHEGASSVNALVVGDELYFCASKDEFDQYGTTGCNEIYLFKFNMKEERLEKITEICRGYHGGVWIYGFWNGEIYFNYSAFDHELSDEEQAALDISKIYTYQTYNIESGAIEEWEQPTSAVYVGKGYFVYEKESGVSVIDESGKETHFEDFPYSSTLEIFDGKIFSPYGKKWGDIAAGKAYPLNVSDTRNSIRDYFDGSFIVKTYTVSDDGQILGQEYQKISQKDLLGS